MTAAERLREWERHGGLERAAAIRATLPAAVRAARQATIRRTAWSPTLRQVDEKVRRIAGERTSDPRSRAKALLQKDRDEFLTRARHALRVQRLRRRARELLDPDAVMREAVERASAQRQLKSDLRAAGWWWRLTGEQTDGIL